MRSLSKIWTKIRRKWAKIRLQPIRVFCLHHVCAEFDAGWMNVGDWMQIDVFKQKIQAMQHEGVEFISLTAAYKHICKDWFRGKKYAVLTFDDGYASLKEILPWLEEQHIPVTLFINSKYLDGVSFRNNSEEKYLTKDELFSQTSQFIEICSHGWEHTDASQMPEVEFAESVKCNIQVLSAHPRYVPFHAYTWGRHTYDTDVYLLSQGIKPVLMDGMKNYDETGVIHRQLL